MRPHVRKAHSRSPQQEEPNTRVTGMCSACKLDDQDCSCCIMTITMPVHSCHTAWRRNDSTLQCTILVDLSGHTPSTNCTCMQKLNITAGELC